MVTGTATRADRYTRNASLETSSLPPATRSGLAVLSPPRSKMTKHSAPDHASRRVSATSSPRPQSPVTLPPIAGGPSDGEQHLTVVERQQRQMRSFIYNFLQSDEDCPTGHGDDELFDDDDNENDSSLRSSFKRVIDLRQHSLDSGIAVTDATLHEVVAAVPQLRGLKISSCAEITDAGIWAVARGCQANLSAIYLAGCAKVTSLGLRLLAHNCARLRVIDLSDCPQITDESLQTLAAGCWQLRACIMRRCPNVSDAGIVKLAQCCADMRRLDLAECVRLGEYGDKALLEIGRCCSKLEVLDLFGCQHVQDAGVRAIAKGCLKLSTLRLSGCRDVSSAAIRVLVTRCRGLRVLSLAGCVKTTNDDLAQLAKNCSQLTWLDISGSPIVDATGVRALAQHATKLEYLSLANCTRINDAALLELAAKGSNGGSVKQSASVLAEMSLAGCPNVTERGVEALALACRSLLTLNLTECAQIGRRFLQKLVARLELVQWATRFFGYEPLPNATELCRERELQARRVLGAVKIQAAMRGCLSRGGLWHAKLKYVERRILPKIQARIRGFLTRARIAAEKQEKREIWAANRLARAYRDLRLRRMLARVKRIRRIRENEEQAAIIFQKVFRGHRARLEVHKIRDKLHSQQQLAARIHALRELAAIKLQRAYRGHCARQEASVIRAAKEAHRQMHLKEVRSAIILQRIYRGHQGRKVRAERLREFILSRKRLEGAITAQRLVRGHRGRRNACILRQEALALREINAALTIQRYWRGLQDKHLASVLIGLVKLRAREQQAAQTIQNAYRLYASRGFARALRLAMQAQRKRQQAAIDIQRVLRGHRGRATAEVLRELWRFEAQAKPLFEKQARLEQSCRELEDQLGELRLKLEDAREDESDLTIELGKTMHIKTKFHDSSRITGTPQRFLTQYLQVQLSDQLRALRVSIALDTRALETLESTYSEISGKLRAVRRELEPLTDGVVNKTRENRTRRLQDRVRSERKAATNIQRMFRGFRARCAVREGTNCWIELWTAAEISSPSCVYYYNTLTGETRWHKPLAMDIFGDTFVKPMSEVVSASTSNSTPAVANEESPMDAADWYEGFDDGVQAAYFYNVRTKEYQWDRPASVSHSFSTVTETSRRRKRWLEEHSQTPDTLEVLLEESEVHSPPLGQWEKRVDPLSEHFFFYNPQLREVRASLSPRSVHESLTRKEVASTLVPSGLSTQRSHRASGRRTARSIEVPGSASRPLHWQYRYGYEYDTGGNLIPLSDSQSARRRIWTEHQDPDSGLPYFYNALSGEYRWDKPADFDVDYETFASGASASSRGRQWFEEKTSSRDQTARENSVRGGGGGGSGRGSVGTSRSSMGVLTSRSVKSRALGKKWVEYVDAESGYAYYYNEITGETRWSLSPRSAQDDKDSDEHISLALFEQVRELRDLPDGDAQQYPGREEHMKWLETSMEEKDWTKVDVLVQQILMRQQNHRAVTAVPSTVSGTSSEWAAYTDGASGSVYYYNVRTGKTSWSNPVDEGAPQLNLEESLDSAALAAAAWGSNNYNLDYIIDA